MTMSSAVQALVAKGALDLISSDLNPVRALSRNTRYSLACMPNLAQGLPASNQAQHLKGKLQLGVCKAE